MRPVYPVPAPRSNGSTYSRGLARLCLPPLASSPASSHPAHTPARAQAFSILGSPLAQACLTVAWAMAGVVAWVEGSRRGSRPMWKAGAVLLGVVLAKLALVDRLLLGNLEGIAAFLAVGVLLVVVVRLAPSPPPTSLQPVPARPPIPETTKQPGRLRPLGAEGLHPAAPQGNFRP